MQPPTSIDMIDDTLHQISTLLLKLTLLPKLTFYLIVRDFQRTYTTDAHAKRGRLLLRTPGPVQLLGLYDIVF